MLARVGAWTGTLKKPMKCLWRCEPNRRYNFFLCVVKAAEMCEVNWLFIVTIDDISVTYVTAHRCAGGPKKKLDLRSGS